ncbi:hypothetical protein HYE43_03760 [Mycoplasmopsis bovis]|nr:hypothetical protein [Mycoplasmopsis bovis]QQH20098.1 hypothetical protein HYE43_03760 [Mycoplasmopsis bovis]
MWWNQRRRKEETWRTKNQAEIKIRENKTPGENTDQGKNPGGDKNPANRQNTWGK